MLLLGAGRSGEVVAPEDVRLMTSRGAAGAAWLLSAGRGFGFVEVVERSFERVEASRA
jgi:hypothetical protein